MYINDLNDVSHQLQSIMFSDDTNLFQTGKCFDEVGLQKNCGYNVICKIMYGLILVLNHQRFGLKSNIHGHDTRQRGNIHLPFCRTTMHQNTICFQGPKLLNHFPNHIKYARTVYMFNKCLQFSLLSSLC